MRYELRHMGGPNGGPVVAHYTTESSALRAAITRVGRSAESMCLGVFYTGDEGLKWKVEGTFTDSASDYTVRVSKPATN